MGKLIDGQWRDEWYDTKSTGGRFARKESTLRGWVRADGSTSFAPEPRRYHLYVSLACPWAHRTLLLRKLKKLERVISVSVVHPLMAENGWSLANPDGTAGCIADYRNLSGYLRELYQVPGVARTVNFQHIKRHYYQSHRIVNPTGVVPVGPRLDLEEPHGRDAIGGAQ